MTTPPPPDPAPPATGAEPPRAQVAPFEPLELPAEDRAANLVDLIHRSVQANATREALRWKLPRTKRMTGSEPETDDKAEWGSRKVIGSASSAGRVRRGSWPTLPACRWVR